MTEESGHVVRIERIFAAPAADVFDAWTSPEVIRRCLHCAPDWDTPEAEVDLRVGGNVRVVMRKPDGTEVEAQGEYTLIDRPHRLVMTWKLLGSATLNGLEPRSGFASAEDVDLDEAVGEGWLSCYPAIFRQ